MRLPRRAWLSCTQAGKGRTGIMICCLLLYLHKNAPDLANLAPAAAAALIAAASYGGHALPLTAAAAARISNAVAPVAACDAGGVSCGMQLDAADPLPLSGAGGCWHPWHFVPPVQLRQLEQPVRDILDMYAERRTHDGNGVTIKSQRRCVHVSCLPLLSRLQLLQALAPECSRLCG